MTVPRRPLLLLVGLTLGPLPACLTTRGPAADARAADPGSQFAADLPRRPGERVPTNPQPAPEPPPAQITTPRPDPLPPPLAPTEPPPPAPIQPAAVDAGPPLQLPTLAPPASSTEPPLVGAVRASVENRPDEAMRLLQALDRPGQEFALSVIPLLMRGAQLNPDAANPNDVAALSEQLRAVADRLEPKAALRVDKVTFCRKVTGFGRYDPWPDGHPYHPRDLAELYVEVRHVVSEPAVGPAGEGFVTKLVSTLEIRDANGRLIEQTDPDDHRRTVPVARFDRTDYSRTPPRDYFLKYRFPVPPAPGVYTVVVEVKDATGRRAVRTKPARFDVAGP